MGDNGKMETKGGGPRWGRKRTGQGEARKEEQHERCESPVGGKKTEAKSRLGMKTELNGGKRKTPERRKDNQSEGTARKRKANEHDSKPQKVKRKKRN